MRQSLFLRILLPLFFALSFCWILLIFVLGRASYKELYEVLDQQMTQTAQMLTVPMDYQNLPELRFSEKDDDDDEYKIHFVVWNKEENVLFADKRGNVLPSSFDQDGFYRIYSGGEEYRVYTHHNSLTGLSASAGYPTSVRTKILKEVVEKFWAPWLIGLLALGLVTYLSLWWGFRPLTRLQQEIQQRDPNHLEKFSTEVPFELRNLKAELNRLIEKIRTQMDKERRFTADAAHELKTPLTAIRVQAEILAMEVDEGHLKKQADKIMLGVDRTNHLIEQLLTLSRLDEQKSQRYMPIQLPDVFTKQQDELKHLIERQRAQVRLDVQEPFVLEGDEVLLGVMFKNLIENSLKYSPPGVEISFKMNSQEFSISDNGPGLPADILERVRERFYRPEGQKEAGSGLGLSIVEKIAELHHLKMILRSPPQGGLQVSFVKGEACS